MYGERENVKVNRVELLNCYVPLSLELFLSVCVPFWGCFSITLQILLNIIRFEILYKWDRKGNVHRHQYNWYVLHLNFLHVGAEYQIIFFDYWITKCCSSWIKKVSMFLLKHGLSPHFSEITLHLVRRHSNNSSYVLFIRKSSYVTRVNLMMLESGR